MTLRNNKRLLMVAMALAVVAGALNVYEAFRPGGGGWKGLGDVLPFVFFAILLGSMWMRIAKQEAEHGPDYTPPASPYARTALVIAALVAAILSAVAVFLILRKG